MTPLSLVQEKIDLYPDHVSRSMQNSWDSLVSLFSNTDSNLEFGGDGWTAESTPWSSSFIDDLLSAWSRSDFVRENTVRAPELLNDWLEPNSELYQLKNEATFYHELKNLTEGCADEASLMKSLRVFRRKEMIRIVWRDLLGWANLDETVSNVTALADSCVAVALDKLYGFLSEKHGIPMSRATEDCPAQQQFMFVLAMGKHGAKELNVSSDIDLIFAYPCSGETDHPRKPIENQLFFTRLGQRLIHALDHINSDGFVFRVDMRLRPYGDSGALVMNYASLEDYYYNQGREWERYAMIKARVVNPHLNQEASEQLIRIIRPFVYRKYADFTSIQALRDMKRMIMAEVHRKGGEQNIKLGSGGIREIEFIAQACQLIYGGRDESLQRTELKAVYELLAQAQYLPQEWVDQLLQSYTFLRNMEHAIQGLNDQQTQMIPDTDEDRQRIAWSLGYETWKQAVKVMQEHRSNVTRCFADFLSEGDEGGEQTVEEHDVWLSFWQPSPDRSMLEDLLDHKGFEDSDKSFDQIQQLRENRLFGAMSSEARQRFDRFFPMLMEAVSETHNPSAALERMLGLIQAILGRSVYFVLLYENPNALRQLSKLCSESPWVADHIAKCPVILDELLDVRSLFSPPDKEQLQDELRQQMLRIPEDDLEAQMNCLRAFKQAHMLRVAASELGGHLPLMKVSDYLTWLAEVLVEEAMHIAWRNLVEKHGLPAGLEDVTDAERSMSAAGFAIVGYGKMGGLELGYSSDLDMVFLYDANDHGMTTGDRSINNQVFYMRLGQRIIHILSAQTTQGMLYETDMRLRPSGNSGMLVSSLAAFEKYQNTDAWTWEHQALVRARGIAGDPALIEQFNRVRADILGQKRDLEALRQDVLTMRGKMKVLAKEGNIKHGGGGLVDIEFITQLGVLSYASENPELLQWSDNIRQLETLGEGGHFGDLDLTPLLSTYRELRAALHRNSLAEDAAKQTIDDFAEQTALVEEIWLSIFKALPELPESS